MVSANNGNANTLPFAVNLTYKSSPKKVMHGEKNPFIFFPKAVVKSETLCCHKTDKSATNPLSKACIIWHNHCDALCKTSIKGIEAGIIVVDNGWTSGKWKFSLWNSFTTQLAVNNVSFESANHVSFQTHFSHFHQLFIHRRVKTLSCFVYH